MIESMSYAVYRHVDLAPVRAFFLDFGLLIADESPERIYFRGYGDAPFIYVAEKGDTKKFIGVGLKVSSLGALEKLARHFDQRIEPSPHPGGGQRVVVFDPDGKPVELVYGAKRVAAVPTREPLHFNSGGKKSRFGRIPIFENEPVPVLDLRHTIMTSQNPQRLIDWLVKELGAYPSDVLVDENKVPMMAFLRFPKGAEYVEHHHIGVSLGAQPSAQHTCFETIDLDAVFMGHRYLQHRGHKGVWGPARHSLGGGVSDYWRDPSGFIVEHVTDGDYVNDGVPTEYSPAASEASTHQWAAGPPADSID